MTQCTARLLFPLMLLLSLNATAVPGATADDASNDVRSNEPSRNTAAGPSALGSVTSGQFDSAVGWNALSANTDGSYNTAFGAAVLRANTDGSYNTGVGAGALTQNTGQDNTAIGFSALAYNLGGSLNTAMGKNALASNNAGNRNTAVGYGALFLGAASDNTAVGYNALYGNLHGSNNIAVGFEAGNNVTGSDNIHIGNAGLEGDHSTIRIGTDGKQTAAYIAGINGTPITGSAVYISSSGQLGVLASSAGVRFDEVAPLLMKEVRRQSQMIAAQGALIASQAKRLELMRQQLVEIRKITTGIQDGKPHQ
jgi:hypothetical protein